MEKKTVIGAHSDEYKAHKHEHKHVEPTPGQGPQGVRGPKGDIGPAGPAGIVKTLRLWVAIIALTTALLTGLGLAGTQIVNLKHQLDQIQQTTPPK